MDTTLVRSLTIDYSTLADYRRCPQRWLYRSLHGLEPQDTSEALIFGKLLHLGLELIYRGKPPIDPAALARARATADYLSSGERPDDVPPDAIKGDLSHVYHRVAWEAGTHPIVRLGEYERRSLGHLFKLLEKYILNYMGSGVDAITPVAYETSHMALLGRIGVTKVYYRGRLDMLEEDRIVETKTTSYLGSSFLDRIKPNDQATGYAWLASSKLDKPVRKILFNGISTSGYGLKSDPSQWPINKKPADLFLRAETYRTEEDMETWKTRTLVTCERLLADLHLWLNNKPLAESTIEHNAPDACTMFNTTCPYIELCRASSRNRATIAQTTLIVNPWEGFSYSTEQETPDA